MNICLLVFLLFAMAIVLGNRRITMRHSEWWAAIGISVCMYLVGKLL